MKTVVFTFLFLVFGFGCSQNFQTMNFNQLTPDEEYVIKYKGTERPFSGKYVNHYEKGTYICKQCNNPLYRSSDKFDSGCGWPSFDDEIPGGVIRKPDADGRRTEILCSRCNAHLGHVFTGEGFTAKDVRHCVNSISLNFVADTPEVAKAYFAGGCFWGVEYYFKKLNGVLSTRVGYSGGITENPTYEEVCTGQTGHAETIEITYNPSVVSYEELVKYFFEIHDPTQLNRQGPDVGTQYRSQIFYSNSYEKQIAEKLINILKSKKLDIVTRVSEFKTFYSAEKYHQNYYEKTSGFPYCHRRIKRF